MKNIFILLLMLPLYVGAQTYEPDFSTLSGTQFDNDVLALKIDFNGKFIAGGQFNSYNGTSKSYLARINEDGSLDETFSPGIAYAVTDIAVHSNSTISVITGGTYTHYLQSGTETFSTTASDGPMIAVAAEPTGTAAIVGGKFNSIELLSNVGNIVRISGGGLDASFSSNAGSGFNDRVRAIKVTDKGKIIVGGDFTSFNGVPRNKIAVLNSDGSLDTSFDPGSALVNDIIGVYAVAIQEDGKILASSTISGFCRVVRFNIDGSVDNEFNGIVSSSSAQISSINTNGTNDIVVTGFFFRGLVALDYTDGSTKELASGIGLGAPYEAAIHPNGKIVVGGNFTSYNGFAANNFVQLIDCNVSFNEHPEDAIACEGGTAEFAVSSTGGQSFQWQVNTNSGSGVYIDLVDDETYSGSTTATLSISDITSDMNGYVYRCVATDSDNSLPTDCFRASSRALLTVSTQSITAQPVDRIVCEGNPTTFSISYSGLSGGFQWQEDPGTGVFHDLEEGDNYTGVNQNSLTVSNTTAEMDGYNYRLISTLCDGFTSNSASLTINEFPVIAEEPSDVNICISGDASFSVAVTGSDLSYRWQYHVGGGNYTDASNGSVMTGVNTSTLQLTGVDNTFQELLDNNNSDGRTSGGFRCIISSNNCEVYSEPAFIYIYEDLEAISQPESVSECNTGTGISTFFEFVAGYGNGANADVNYQWQVDEGDGFLDIVNDGIYSGAASYRLNVSQAPTSYNEYKYRCIADVCSSPVFSDEVELTISDRPEITQQPSSSVAICEDGSAEIIVTATGDNLTYQWQEDINGNLTDIINDETFFASDGNLQISNAEANMNNRRYRCVISSADGCSINSISSLLRVYPTPSFSPNTQDRTVCEGSATSITRPQVFNFNSSIHSYQWQEAFEGSDIFSDISDDDNFSNTTTPTLSIAAATSSMNGNKYRIKIVGCEGDIFSEPALLTVNQVAIISESPLPQSICSGESATFNVEAIGTDLRYQWYENDGNGFVAITTVSTSGELNLNNVEKSRDGAIFKCRIFPAAPCTVEDVVETSEVTLTVNENPAVVDRMSISNFPICEGEDVEVSVELSSGNPTIQWQEDRKDGNGFIDVVDNEIYSGSSSSKLSIKSVSFKAEDVYEYRTVLVENGCEIVSPKIEMNVYRQFGQPVLSVNESNPEAPVLSVSNLPDYFEEVSGAVNWYRNDDFVESGLTFTPIESGNYAAVVEEVGTDVVCMSIPSEPYTFQRVLGANLSVDISIYPNPTSDFVNIGVTRPVNVRMYGLDGRKVLEEHIESGQPLDIKLLRAGHYILQVSDGGELILTQKIIKTN